MPAPRSARQEEPACRSEAIALANADAAADIITGNANLAGGKITLGSELPFFDGDMTIDGEGHASRIVDYTPGVDRIELAKAVFHSLADISYDAGMGALTFAPDGPGGALPIG